MKNELNRFYEELTLSDDKMEELLSLQTSLKKPKPGKKLPFLAGLIAASIALFIFIQVTEKPLDQKIIAEVVYNHKKDMPPEVLSEDYLLVNQALDKLDFKLLKSKRLATNYQLVGGRYCSIQGKIAAQLKLVELKSNKRITLYQFKPNFSPIISEGVHNGVVVKIWHEDGISFALAKE